MRVLVASFVACFALSCTDTLGTDEGPSIAAVRLAIPQNTATAIGKKWDELRLAGIMLGDPSAEEQPVPGGAPAIYQPYAAHVIVYSNDFGAVYMPMAFFSKWINLPVYAQFGVPTSDYDSYANLYDFVEFSGGFMISDGVGGARVVYGQIYRKFRTYLRELGAPLTEEADTPGVPGGRFQVFVGGEVHWGKLEERDPGTTDDDRWDAVAVFEPILGQWRAQGSPAGGMGLPLYDSATIIDATDADGDGDVKEVIGRSGRFKQGDLYHNAATGSFHQVIGQILPVAYESHGGPGGWLGWPLFSTGLTAGGKRYNNFEHGLLVERQTPDRLVAEAFGNLIFHLGSVAGPDDCFFAADSDPDLYFKVDVDSSQGKMVDNMPWGDADHSFDTHPYPVNADLGTSRVANSALTITASVDIFDEDGGLCRANDHLGKITFNYDIDNLWGLGSSDQHFFGSLGSPTWATFNIKSSHPFDEKDFRGQKYWGFHNFSTARLDKDLYADTFADIDEEFDPEDVDDIIAEPFKVRFFHDFFKGIADGGNCSGMNIESIHAQKGRSIAGMPINEYLNTNHGHRLSYDNPMAPGDDPAVETLYKDINLQHASQLGADVILWKVNEFLRTQSLNPGGVPAHVRNFEDVGDYTTLNMTTAGFGGSVHSVRPYRIEDYAHECVNLVGQTNCLRIFVADPNSPAIPSNPPAPDENRTRPDDNFIEFSNDGTDFSYRWTDGSTLTEYSNISGGIIWFEASHLYASPQVTPFGQWWLDLYKAYMVVVGTSGKTKQITDAQGRTMFEQVQGYPNRWDHIRQDPAMRIPNLAPVLQTDALADRAQGWIGFGVGETHDYDIIPTVGVAAQTPVNVTLQSAGVSSIFSLPAIPGKADRVTAHDINGSTKAISLALPADGTAKAVTWLVSGGNKKRWMELSALGMLPAQNIRIRAENGGRRLVINNSGPQTSATLRYNEPDRAGGPVNLGTVTILASPLPTTIDPDNLTNPPTFTPQSLAPVAWYRASASTVIQSGTAVTEWLDSSGNGQHLTQVNTAARPSYSATGWNGSTPAVTFDGVDDFLEYATPSGRLLSDLAGADKPFSVLLTWEALDLDADYDLVQWDNGGANGGNSLIELRTNQTGPDEAKYRHRRGDGVTSLLNTSTVKFNPGRRTTAFVFDGTALSIYDGTATHLSASPNDRNALTLVRFRLAGGDNRTLNGRVAELVVTPYALSSSTVQQYRTYAQQTWGGL